jgi:hypothetical protein
MCVSALQDVAGKEPELRAAFKKKYDGKYAV